MNHHITIVCPGQGSQSVGMLSSFDDDFVNSEYEKIIDKAAEDIENFIVKVNSENPLQ